VILNHLTRALLLIALVLVFQRGLHRRCWSFVVNLAVVIVCGFLMSAWPDVFYTRGFYAWTRDLYAALKLLIALELGHYVFHSFPRAMFFARTGSMLILAVLAASVATRMPWAGWADWSFSRGSFNAATVWLFGGMALLVLWYNLPLDRWHATIIGGFTAYLVLSSVVLASEGIWRAYGKMLDPLLAGWWAYSACAYGRAKVPAPVVVRA
jgi:hypothetical protein